MRSRAHVFLLLLAGSLVHCAAGAPARRYSVEALEQSLGAKGDASLVLGEYRLAPDPVLDGDTIRVEGLDATLRLLAIDTEETFKKDKERRAYEKGFERYLRELRGDSKRPVKAATPLGEEAKRWAEDFFRDVSEVRLERDHPGEIRGYFNRYLTYVFALKDERWVNYNLECVRAGMSPYFQKYGRSRRFHEAFVKAQEEARAARRGIWAPGAEAYPDYDERLSWWDGRGETIRRFEEQAEGREDHVVLTRWNSDLLLEAREGQETVVFGSVGEVRRREKGPTSVLLSKRRFADFPLIFWKDEVLAATGLEQHAGEFVAVRGRLTKYVDRGGRATMQMVVEDAGQVTLLGAAPGGSGQ